jgi:HAD superfamily hydrolase (TIGR01549 family)
MLSKRWGVLLDLDQTLILTAAIEPLRRRRAWSEVYRSFGKTALPPGTPEFIAEMQRLATLGVVTTSPRSYAERLLSHHGLDIPVLVAYHDVSRRKPDPEPILKAAAKLGLEPARCIHVGDQPGDLTAAIRAGAIAIGLTWDGTLDTNTCEGPVEGCCSSWNEVYDLIVTLLPKEKPA